MISHSNVLRPETTGVSVSLHQADGAVFHPLGMGHFELRGVIARDEWVRVSQALLAGS